MTFNSIFNLVDQARPDLAPYVVAAQPTGGSRAMRWHYLADDSEALHDRVDDGAIDLVQQRVTGGFLLIALPRTGPVSHNHRPFFRRSGGLTEAQMQAKNLRDVGLTRDKAA